MQISLMGNHSTFGIAYTSPPEKFTTGDPLKHNGEYLDDKYLSIATFDVPKDQTYFVNVVHETESKIERGTLSFGDVVKIKGQTLSCLNPRGRHHLTGLSAYEPDHKTSQ